MLGREDLRKGEGELLVGYHFEDTMASTERRES
jgi:hypothetical protein